MKTLLLKTAGVFAVATVLGCGSGSPLERIDAGSGGTGSGGTGSGGTGSGGTGSGSQAGAGAPADAGSGGVGPSNLDYPRLLAPLSTATVTSARPTLKWQPGLDTDATHVQICRDRACTVEVTAFDAAGSSGKPAANLPAGVLFWRVFGEQIGVTKPTPSATWEFTVGPRTAAVDSSWGTALDVNRDGYVDVLVGAPGFDGATGRAYLYLGSATGLGSTPTVTLVSPASAGGQFGASVASAGDVDGDGYADVIVGAPGLDSAAGRAYLYLGSATGLGSTPAVTLPGMAGPGGAFGTSVASAGDVNGDGYADVIIGAPASQLSPGGHGYVYLGSATGLGSTPAVTLTDGPSGAGAKFGSSVASAGDTNGDGYADVIVGAPAENMTGTAFVYLGSATGLSSSPVARYGGHGSVGSWGAYVGSAGDINGDGYADLVVGDGRGAYVYLGGAAGPASGASTAELTGPGVPNAGDFNGDGYGDLLVGTTTAYLGSATGLSSPITLSFGQGGQSTSTALTSGDVNGDGYADAVVGQWDSDSDSGRVSLYLGSATGPAATPASALTGPDGPTCDSCEFGNVVANAGDVNGDGYGDALVTTINHASYLYLGGGSGLAAAPAVKLVGPPTNDAFSAAGAGDVNGDGYDDAILGVQWTDSAPEGEAYLYLGSAAGLAATPALTLLGPPALYSFGQSVGSAGDVNGDGYGDVLIGGYGVAYVYAGSAAGLGSAPAVTLTDPDSLSSGLAALVAGVRDLNKDGYDDVVALWSGGGDVYLGGKSGLASTPAVTFSTPDSATVEIISIIGAGDVNGDGYADVVLTGNLIVDGGTRIYVYLGSAAGLASSPAVTLNGPSCGGTYLCPAVSAGDLNKDGYSDIVVGTWGSAPAATAGTIEVYLGSATGPAATPMLMLTGPDDANGEFAASVATFDANGDGYADLLVGAPGVSAKVGRAYVFAGGAEGLPLSPSNLAHRAGPRGRRVRPLRREPMTPGPVGPNGALGSPPSPRIAR